VSHDSSYDTKQRIKQAVDIVDLVGTYLPLRREGRGFKAICPWHDDTRPSLQVNPDRQSFKCWVCDIGGDVFSFMMKIEGIEFPEALSMLADRANISLQPAARGSAPQDEKRTLYQAMGWSFQQYHECLLKDPRAAAARAYLAERKMTPEMVRQFQLGYAPDEWNWITDRAQGTPYAPALLERIGLVSRRRQGPGYYDRFKGRVLFPIYDPQGRGVGLGGRVLPQLATPETAKYVNSPETPLFSKSSLLYGLNIARDAIAKKKTVLVTEGYTDCITAHQFGFDNTVAVLGTAVGEAHLRLLRRYADRIRVVLVLDGDEAGRKRAKEVLELFVAGNVDLRVLTLPDAMDPAEFLFAHGAEALQTLIDSAVDALGHAFTAATAGLNLQSDLHGATQALEQLAATIAKAPRLRSDTQAEDRLREERFLQRLAADFHVPEEQVRRLVTEMRRRAASRAPVRTAADASVPRVLAPLERELLEILLHFPDKIAEIWGRVSPQELPSELCRRIYAKCGALWEQKILPDYHRLLLEIDDAVVKNLLVELDEGGHRKVAGDVTARLQDVLSGFERRRQEHWLRTQTAALKQRHIAEEDQLAVLQELERQQRTRQEENESRARSGSSEPTDG